MSKIFSKKGETLLEVLIALTIITVASAAAGSAIMSAVQGLSLSKNYLIAQNLADEGLEAVKNIRDTNWMKFPIDKDTCWLVIENMTSKDGNDCATATSFQYKDGGASNDYLLKFETDKWTATSQAVAFDPNITPTLYALSLADATGRYENNATGTPVFYRAIRVVAQAPGSITIDSIVQWYEGTKPYSITGEEVLTNYLQ
jgi:type II secretory pathway pseudopilin PulG